MNKKKAKPYTKKIGPFTITSQEVSGDSLIEDIQNLADDEAALAYTNYQLWEFKARQLAFSAKQLWKEEKHKVDQIPYMLYALAIEVSLKGIVIKNKSPKLDNNYHLINGDELNKFESDLSSHNLDKLFSLSNIKITEDEKRVAYKLKNIIENFGKYPTAKPGDIRNFILFQVIGEIEHKLVNEIGKKAGLNIFFI